MTLCPTTK
jgi:hypothetical protein